MMITRIADSVFRVGGCKFSALIDVSQGPHFYEIMLGGLRLPDWDPQQTWIFPETEEKICDQLMDIKLQDQEQTVVLSVTYGTTSGDMEATLHWSFDRDYDVAECHWVLKNNSQFERHATNLLPFQFSGYSSYQSPNILYLTASGKGFATQHTGWTREYHPRSVALEPGTRILLSEHHGISSLSQHPWMYITWPGEAFTFIIASAWSGNWRINAENTYEHIRLSAGLSEPDDPIAIAPGQTEILPSIYLFLSPTGMDGAANAMNRYIRARLLPGERLTAPREYPTLNHMHYFGVPEPDRVDSTSEEILESARKAKELGHFFFDISIMWFKVSGNWYKWVRLDHPTPQSFPEGLKQMVDQLKAMGMQVAAWVEPERASLNGGKEFLERFPDGILYRENSTDSSGLIDLGRDDIADWLFEKLDNFLTNYQIDGLFYDHNFSFNFKKIPDRSSSMLRYYQNLYKILDRLRFKHPKVRILMCAGGGRRVDLGILRHSHAIQASDSTHPLLMLRQAWAASLLMPIELVERYAYTMHWNEWQGEELIRYGRFLLRSAMMGTFSSANDYTSMNDAALKLLEEHNRFYREKLIPIINGADVYRLSPIPEAMKPVMDDFSWDPDFTHQPQTASEWFALQEHQPEQDKHALFIFRLNAEEDTFCAKLRAINPNMKYRIRNWDLGAEQVMNGAVLAEHGIKIHLDHNYDSAVVLVESLPGQ